MSEDALRATVGYLSELVPGLSELLTERQCLRAERNRLHDEKKQLREALIAALVLLEIHADQFQAMRFPVIDQVKTALHLTRPGAGDE